jgi:hypothetical protein
MLLSPVISGTIFAPSPRSRISGPLFSVLDADPGGEPAQGVGGVTLPPGERVHRVARQRVGAQLVR